MKNLLIRSLSGAVYVAAIVGSLILNIWLFAILCLAFNVLGLFEFQKFSPGNNKDKFYLPFAGALLFILFHFCFTGTIQQKWFFLAIAFPLVGFSSELYKNGANIFTGMAFNLSALVYITVPLILLDYLNIKLTGSYSNVVIIIFALIWANDTFAYLSGMLMGRHKLFERVTPKKTWEGFIGGMLATVLIAWALFSFSGFVSLLQWLVLSMLVSIVSVFGDFVESLFKRTAGVKDSGKIIPGHGGILDRIDSLLFVFPVVFIYFELIS